MSVPASEVAPGHYCADQKDAIVKAIAARLPWYSSKYSPHDVPRFYDITGVTECPETFQKVVDLLVARYASASVKPTVVAGFDARGFVLGAPVALALKLPFALIRKKGKMPGVLVSSGSYQTEYSTDETVMRLGSVKPGDRVLLIDDLIATGGTALAGFDIVSYLGGEVHEFASMIQLPFLEGVRKIHTYKEGKYSKVPVFTVVDDSSIGDGLCRDPPEGTPQVVPGAEAVAALEKYSIGDRF